MKIVSWNLEGRLSDLSRDGRGTPEKIVDAIRRFDADILVHPEAFGSEPAMAPEIESALRELGYELHTVAYHDAHSRGEVAAVSNPSLLVMSRLRVVSSHIIRPGDVRNMLSVTVYDPATDRHVRVLGIHLDDRSERLRLRQVAPLIEYINDSTLPTVMMGDFNAMPPQTLKSALIHGAAFRALLRAIPHQPMRYVLERLNEMASGTTIMRILGLTNLRNIDPALQPTTTPKRRHMEWMPSIRVAKIDWIFVSPDIGYKNFAVSRDLGSDHRALSAEIFVKKR